MLAMTSNKYVTEALKTLRSTLKEQNKQLPSRALTPLSYKYKPEVDDTAELNVAERRFYQELIGILRCAVELGPIDIQFEVSRMTSYMASPRTGHFEQVLHIFGYLQNVPKLTLAMDSPIPDISEDRFIEADWHDFYRDAKEEIPPNLPVPKGKPVTISCFVDASHACDVVTCCSLTTVVVKITSN